MKKGSIEIGNATSTKVGRVFPMVISSEFRMGQYRDDDHREYAPHFITQSKFNFSAFPPLTIVNIDTIYFFIALYELIWHVVVSDFEKAFRFDYGWNLF